MKRVNEAKFRSPKWLRNYLDFEVNTGDDITGQPSERRMKADAEKAKKEAAKKAREYWSKRWKEADPTEFKEFYKEVYNNGRSVYSFDLEDIQKKWKDDNRLWDSFDKWLEKKRAEKQEQEKIEKELNDLYRLLENDFISAPYYDKIKTPTVGNERCFHYTFENGKLFRIEGDRFYWESSIYTVGLTYKAKFVQLANSMIRNCKERPRKSGYDRYDSYGSNSGSSGYRQSSSQQRKANTPPKWKDHPKGPMYQNLKDTVRLRKEQLAKTSKTDPNYDALKNELETAEAMIKKMNQKYQFEGIRNFSQFNLILESSKFVDQEEFDSLLDKIGDEGMQSLSDIEKKKLELFSKDDAPIYDLIDQMADITLKFKDINQRMDELTDTGKSDEAQKIFKDEWQRANDEIIIIEREIESYGIELGDSTFVMMMKKHRPDAYGYDPNREEGLEEMEI
jgi:hypothetical protein